MQTPGAVTFLKDALEAGVASTPPLTALYMPFTLMYAQNNRISFHAVPYSTETGHSG